MSKIKDNSSEKSKKQTPTKLPSTNLSKLTNARIIQKHLIYVIGLSSTLANKDILCLDSPNFADSNCSILLFQMKLLVNDHRLQCYLLLVLRLRTLGGLSMLCMLSSLGRLDRVHCKLYSYLLLSLLGCRIDRNILS